jgi:hypothetical protein
MFYIWRKTFGMMKNILQLYAIQLLWLSICFYDVQYIVFDEKYICYDEPSHLYDVQYLIYLYDAQFMCNAR